MTQNRSPITIPPDMIGRLEILDLMGISKTTLFYISRLPRLKFPKPVLILAHCTQAYDRAEVLTYLEKIDRRELRLTEAEKQAINKQRRPKTKPPAKPTFSHPSLPIGGRRAPKAADTTKPRQRLHVRERHEYIPPHPGLAWDGSAEVESYALGLL